MAKTSKYRDCLRTGKWSPEQYFIWLAGEGNASLEREAVAAFNVWIVVRDGKCLRCGKTENLTCSHFWTSKRKNTKFDEENCICACNGCHLFVMEKEKQGEYTDIMLELLGPEKMEALKLRAQESKRMYAPDYVDVITASYQKVVDKLGSIVRIRS